YSSIEKSIGRVGRVVQGLCRCAPFSVPCGKGGIISKPCKDEPDALPLLARIASGGDCAGRAGAVGRGGCPGVSARAGEVGGGGLAWGFGTWWRCSGRRWSRR